MKLFSAITVLLATAITISLAPSVYAAGSIGGRPALPREDEPRSQSIFIHELKQGSSTSDKLLVTNASDKKETIILGTVDAIPSNTGAFTCKQASETITGAGGWIKLATKQIDLEPGKSEIIDFTITAPKAADVGEQNACITLEAKDSVDEVNGNLRIRTRSAIRVALTIPGKLNREVSIDSYSATVDNYKQHYSIVLNNTGNVSADSDVSVSLRSLFGTDIFTSGGQYPILPGNKLELVFDNDKSPFFGGWYKAVASVKYDKNASQWGTQTASSLAVISADEQIVFLMPHPVAIILLMLIVLLVVFACMYFILKRKNSKTTLASWYDYQVKPGDTIEKLAASNDISWQQLAKVNKIEAPYTLTKGSVIKVPKAPAKKIHIKG